MQHNSIYSKDQCIRDFYEFLVTNRAERLKELDIPISDIFYIRYLLNTKFKLDLSLDDVKILLEQEGLQ